MLYTVREFCGYVQDDLNGLIDEVAGITRYVSDEEKKAYAGSYPVVADMLVQAMKKQPAIGDAHICIGLVRLGFAGCQRGEQERGDHRGVEKLSGKSQ